MLKVACESCKAPYQVDPRRVPPQGLKMRCPKCGHAFLVRNDDASEGAPAAASSVPNDLPRPVAPRIAPRAGAVAPSPSAAAPPPRPSELDLPAPAGSVGKGADLPSPARRPPPPAPAIRTAARNVPPPAPSAPAALPLDSEPESDDFGFDLPATIGRPGAAAKPAAPPPEPGDDDDDLADLPAALADLPSRARNETPLYRRPAAPPAVPQAGPPSRAAAATVSSSPPAVFARPRALGFGEIDLPVAAGGHVGLPAVPNDLPLRAKTNDLPAAVDDARHLPAVAKGGRAAPAPLSFAPVGEASSTGFELGGASDDGGSGSGTLDDFGELDLPAAQSLTPRPAPPPPASVPSFAPSPLPRRGEVPAIGSLVPPSGRAARSSAFGHDDSAAGVGSLSPNALDAGASEADEAAFGDFELPLPPGPAAGTASRNPVPAGGLPMAPRSMPRGANVGGMAFGEVDLGGGDTRSANPPEDDDPFGTEAPLASARGVAHGGAAPLSPSPAPAAPRAQNDPVGLDFAPNAATQAHQAHQAAGGEAAIPTSGRPRRDPTPLPRSSGLAGNLGKVLGALLGVSFLGGAGLSLTSYGPFGYVALSDHLHAGEYAAAATQAASAFHTGAAPDVFASARAAADAAAALRAKSPRGAELNAVAAFAEFVTQLRFGGDGDRATQAKLWLSSDFMKEASASHRVPYLDLARAAQAAVEGDAATARAGFASASSAYGSTLLVGDVARARGEVELEAFDAVAAQAAFQSALAAGPTAAAQYGLARAAELKGDWAEANRAIAATLAASPSHAGALILRAHAAWAKGHDDDATARASADLKAALDTQATGGLSPHEAAEAQATRGWIQLARGHAADARAAFDAALQLDARNPSALLGQGEMLYQDGRVAEALSRFDTAVQVDPRNVRAVAYDAKAKIGLERLADAKNQLEAARALAPRSPLLARWLGASESALGNKKAAEVAFREALSLIAPNDPDAVEPYAALARFLSMQGRAADAAAVLDEAHQKLPDSAALERAIGDVSVARGAYDDAIARYKAALDKDHDDVATRFLLGQTLRRMNKVADASRVFDEVAAKDPEYPGLSLERGLVYEQSGDVAKALAAFQAALAKAPNDPDLELRVGAAYVGVGKAEEALPLLKKVREQRPTSAEAIHYSGRAHLLQGPLHLVDAMRDLRRAVELDPNHAEYHLYVGWAAATAEPPQLGLAKSEVEQALTLDKLLGDAYWLRATIEQSEGAINDGIRDARHALELKPTRFEAYATMALCFEQKNDLGQAAASWQKALAGGGNDPFWHFKYGRLLVDHGSAALAADQLKLAVDAGALLQARPGWLSGAYYLLGEAARKAGRKSDAVDAYTHFLDVANANDPDRKDAVDALKRLGSPWNGGD